MALSLPEDPILNKIRNAPRKPGVYIMKDAEGRILYIGKAKDLNARIRAYWSGTDSRFMAPFLVSKVCDVEFLVTATEKEALILEINLIKEHRPRYNIDFRDDKAYFHIRFHLSAPFPRFQLVRRPRKDGARYFGPYPSSAAAKETLSFLQTVFPLRTCRDVELRSRRRPCLEYEIGRCAAPCVGRMDAEAYDRVVRDALAFLEGKGNHLVSDLEGRMRNLAAEERFEEAAVLRDRLAAVRTTLERQRIVAMTAKDQDVFGVYREGRLTQVCVLFIRQGKVVGHRAFPLVKLAMETPDILSSLLKQYYDGIVHIPTEMILPVELEEQTVLQDWLGEKRGRNVDMTVPARGRGVDLIRLAESNARNIFETLRTAPEGAEDALKRLVEVLGLHHFPERIECFDISNIGGKDAVASMVTFLGGRPCKAAYRRFRIRTVTGADDYAMMYEALQRRFNRDDPPRPNLLMVDGGKGQLSVALSVLKDGGIAGMDVIALAKAADEAAATGPSSPREQKKGPLPKGEDRVYVARRKEPIYLSRWPSALFLLQRIRDEAHRFAVAYHHKVKEKEDLQSLLDHIGGIGPSRKKALLIHFGDVKKIRKASLEALQQVKGIGKETAAEILLFFQQKQSAD